MKITVGARAVVTGAGSGLGRALCAQLGARGARIVAADIDLARAEETVALLPSADAHAVACDVSRHEEVKGLLEKSVSILGGVDFIANNAGVAVSGNVGDVSLEDWQWIAGINLWGVVYGCHYFLPRFRAQGSGAILNVASAAGLLCAPGMGPYNVTKAGVVALSETLQGELYGTGVSVSVLCPTFFRTNIMAGARGANEKGREVVAKLMDRSRVQADDVARIALDAVDRGRLYVLPHDDGRWMWRLKRAVPQGYFGAVGRLFRRGILGPSR